MPRRRYYLEAGFNSEDELWLARLCYIMNKNHDYSVLQLAKKMSMTVDEMNDMITNFQRLVGKADA